MKPFTVVLLRPTRAFADTASQYGQDIYVALVSAEDKVEAVYVAQLEAHRADQDDGAWTGITSKDYKLCVLFEGHQDPKLFGWQTF